jgi:hypothetical protein
MRCPYCLAENAQGALVCTSCSRDIGIPPTLIAERDDLVRKRDLLLNELKRARSEVDMIRRGRKPR